MTPADGIRTPRLQLRPWRDDDAPAMAAINRDPDVARYLNRPVAPDGFLDVVTDHWARHGFGFWALESREPGAEGTLVGLAGVAYAEYLPELADRPELGWRLARSAWGRGLAAEAVRAARADAATRLGLGGFIAVIHPHNDRSRRLASRLGLRVQQTIHNPWLGREVDVWA